jgi:hypothetical protein
MLCLLLNRVAESKTRPLLTFCNFCCFANKALVAVFSFEELDHLAHLSGALLKLGHRAHI